MNAMTVIFVEPTDDLLEIWQFFECMADNDDHAEEQCLNAHPNAKVLWVNSGHGTTARVQD